MAVVGMVIVVQITNGLLIYMYLRLLELAFRKKIKNDTWKNRLLLYRNQLQKLLVFVAQTMCRGYLYSYGCAYNETACIASHDQRLNVT